MFKNTESDNIATKKQVTLNAAIEADEQARKRNKQFQTKYSISLSDVSSDEDAANKKDQQPAVQIQFNGDKNNVLECVEKVTRKDIEKEFLNFFSKESLNPEQQILSDQERIQLLKAQGIKITEGDYNGMPCLYLSGPPDKMRKFINNVLLGDQNSLGKPMAREVTQQPVLAANASAAETSTPSTTLGFGR